MGAGTNDVEVVSKGRSGHTLGGWCTKCFLPTLENAWQGSTLCGA